MATKQAWNTAFATYLAWLDSKKPVIWCGDFNVVQDERDLAGASKKWNKTPGYTAIECDAHRELIQGTATPTSKPLVDVWRQKHPDAVGHYSEYSPRLSPAPAEVAPRSHGHHTILTPYTLLWLCLSQLSTAGEVSAGQRVLAGVLTLSL